MVGGIALGIVLAMALATPVVGLQSDGAPPCDTAAFASDLRTLRPELTIVFLEREQAPADAWLVRLVGVPSGHAEMRVAGNPTPVLRLLSGSDCRRVVEVAASIVDGLLDQVPRQASGTLSSGGPLRTSLAVWAGAGALQGPIRWVPAFQLGLRFALGDWEIVGASDLGLLATLPVSTADFGAVGSYKALPFDFEIGGGYAPRLGPGNLSLDALIGPSAARVWAKGSPLFGLEAHTTLETFVALAAGYTIDLPARFFVGVRVEERWAPTQAHFAVEDGTPEVITRTWTFMSTLLIGWRVY